MFGNVHHIGYRVGNLDEAIELYGRLFDAKLTHRETLKDRNIEIAFVQAGQSLVEFIQPLGVSADTGIQIDHIAYETDDIERDLNACRAKGIKIQDERPRTNSRGQKVAFLANDAVNGARIQFVQPS
ncbi:MAG: VOC family protein [Chloroflexi bacterium]|nr:VOC family protein [Chloroflexota bacterium]